MRVTLRIAMLLAAVAGCHRAAPFADGWQPRFGPVVNDEVIVGRVAAGGKVWLMTSKDALVRVDMDEGAHARLALHPLERGEHAWGLASTGAQDEGFWTLTGRRELAHVTEGGVLDKRMPLEDPHVTLYSGPRQLVYQVVNMLPPADALVAGPPGASPRRRWSRMRTRPLPLQRVETAALNIILCGVGERDTIPCWFAEQATVTLAEANGDSREIALEGVRAVEPDALLASVTPRKPIADAWMSSAGELWALTAGEPARADLAERRGARTLGRYRADGTVLRRVPLPEPARLILRVRGARAALLAWDGRVVEVEP